MIVDLQNFLEEKVFKTDQGLYVYKLLDPIPQALPQRGQVCKLNALSLVLNWLHQSYNMPSPLPVRKDKKHGYSIRQLAKEKYGSKVGEVYSAKILSEITKHNGYSDSEIINTTNTSYIDTVRSLIDQGEAPIIFFDNDLWGEPIQANSQREHAAVVIGYFSDKENELNFIFSQWGNYYWAKAMNIADSANQLSPCRTPETFYKYGDTWHEHEALAKTNPLLFMKTADKTRQAQQLPPDDGGLKNQIFVVHKKQAPIKTDFFALSSTKNGTPPSTNSPSLLKFTDSESEKLLLAVCNLRQNLNS